jgi:hypothetical protein
VPAALRWINFVNPYFYTIMGLIKIEFDDYKFPGGFVRLPIFLSPMFASGSRPKGLLSRAMQVEKTERIFYTLDV